MRSNDTPPQRIVVAGAGAIGCFVGGLLLHAGREVSFLGRPRIFDSLRRYGLRLTDYSGLDLSLAADQLDLHEDAAILGSADLILVCVKYAATPDLAAQIAAQAHAGAAVVSLQNGIGHADTLRAALPAFDVRAGMVPFNVVPMENGQFHRASSGEIVIGAGQGAVADTLSVPALPVSESDEIEAVQWGKFLLNLNNAPNALSGLTLHAQLLSRPWRRLMADQMVEALSVLRAHGIAIKPTTPVPAAWVPHILRLPTPVFRRIAARMLTIDPQARTSMAYDLLAGRVTEVDALQGKIVEMGQQKAIPMPITAALLNAVRAAEQHGFVACRPESLRP